jgi:hypothetical protein
MASKVFNVHMMQVTIAFKNVNADWYTALNSKQHLVLCTVNICSSSRRTHTKHKQSLPAFHVMQREFLVFGTIFFFFFFGAFVRSFVVIMMRALMSLCRLLQSVTLSVLLLGAAARVLR